MCNVRSGVTDVSVHLAHDSDMLITVQQRVFLISCPSSPATVGCPVRFEAGVRQNNNEPLRVFIVGGDWYMLFRNETWKFRRRK